MSECFLCPRRCGADRSRGKGYCGCGDMPRVAKFMLHFGEEPCITGTNGSGAVFFSGCNLRCAFCQNFPISHGCKGEDITPARLEEIFFELKNMGAHNINLVTAAHFSDVIADVLARCKDRLGIPVVYNSGGYESVESLRRLDGLIDIYLPDLKYYSSELSARYSGAADYFERAFPAIREMRRQQPAEVFDNSGLLKNGVIVRHLVLPKAYRDSIELMRRLKAGFGENSPLVSVMRQYTPCYGAENIPEINRHLTTFEYEKVIDACAELGLQGFSQEKGCDNLDMTPEF